MNSKSNSPNIIQQYLDSYKKNAQKDVSVTCEEAVEYLFSNSRAFNAKTFAYTIDLATQSIISLTGVEQVLGIPESEFSLYRYHELIHPDDLENMMNATNEAFAHIVEKKETAPLTAQLCLTYRMRHADGRYLHIQDTTSILASDKDGNPLKGVATFSDMSQIPFTQFTGHLSCPCNGFLDNFTTIDNSVVHISKYGFTRRESEIVELLRQGKSSEEIARNLFISRHTVDKHRSNILEKAGLSRTQQLVSFFS